MTVARRIEAFCFRTGKHIGAYTDLAIFSSVSGKGYGPEKDYKGCFLVLCVKIQLLVWS